MKTYFNIYFYLYIYIYTHITFIDFISQNLKQQVYLHLCYSNEYINNLFLAHRQNYLCSASNITFTFIQDSNKTALSSSWKDSRNHILKLLNSCEQEDSKKLNSHPRKSRICFFKSKLSKFTFH